MLRSYGAFTLRPKQQEAVDWLTDVFVCNGLPHRYLAYPPGAGKTVMVGAGLVDTLCNSALIVCPTKVKTMWARTLIAMGYARPEQICIVNEKAQKFDVRKYKVVIVSFELLHEEIIQLRLKDTTYGAVIVDEAHKAGSVTSATSHILFGQNALVGYGYHKWCLSGTPAPNRLNQLYPVVAALYPAGIEPHNSYEKFCVRLCGFFEKYDKGRLGLHPGRAVNVSELRERLQGFFLYKTLPEIETDLPPIYESIIYINIGELGYNLHNTPMATLQKHLGIAKINQGLEYIKEWHKENPGKKLLTFAYHREVIEALHRGLSGAVKLYGGMNNADKDRAIGAFCQGYAKDMICQISSGGEAIDGLQHAAHDTFVFEPNWSPGTDNQGIGRIYRIGQTKPVHVIRFIAEGTLDETKLGSMDGKQDTLDQMFESQQTAEVIMSEEIIAAANAQTAELARIGDVLEDIADILGNLQPATAPKRTRRSSEEVAAEKAAKAAAKGAATNGASTHGAGFALPAAPQNAYAGMPVQQMPMQQLPQQPPLPPINAAPNGAYPQDPNAQASYAASGLTWQQVYSTVQDAIGRLTTQFGGQVAEGDPGLAAARQKITSVINSIGFQSLGDMEQRSNPAQYAMFVQAFQAVNHIPAQQAQQPVASGAPALGV